MEKSADKMTKNERLAYMHAITASIVESLPKEGQFVFGFFKPNGELCNLTSNIPDNLLQQALERMIERHKTTPGRKHGRRH